MGSPEASAEAVELTEPPLDEAGPLVDLSDVTLERIARLCDPAVSGLAPEDVQDRPALRRALLRVQQEGEHPGGLFAGFSSHLP
jgi:hypothetical protein